MGIKQQKFEDYEGFIEKFKPKKTTDDCFTPQNIYDTVRDWAVREYGLHDRPIVRPFWPGEDYEHYDYPKGCVVIDNPPFSILSSIVKWFNAAGIDYFLFSPYLTNFSIRGCNHVIAPATIRYANGALVSTSFVTNMGEWFIRNAPELMDKIKEANAVNRKKEVKTLPKYSYPMEVISSAAVGYLCIHHTPFALNKEDCQFVRKIDANGKGGIFGGGYLLSKRAAAERAAAERAAAERAAAERAAAERAAAIKLQLSPREIELQKTLGKPQQPEIEEIISAHREETKGGGK